MSKTQAPRVEEEPRTMEVEEGEPVKFTCRITGKPRKSCVVVFGYDVC